MKIGSKMSLFLTAMMFLSFTFRIPAHAFTGPNPNLIEGDMTMMLSYTRSIIEYKVDKNDDSGDIDRQIIGVSFSKNINEKVNLAGGLGYVLDGVLPIDNDNIELDNDKGLFADIGGSFKFFARDNFAAYTYGQLDYTVDESYNKDHKLLARLNNGTIINLPVNTEIEIDGYEFTMGLMGKFSPQPNFALYGGIELTPISQYDLTLKVVSEPVVINGQRIDSKTSISDSDAQRDDILSFRLGAIYNANQYFVKSEGVFGSERAFMIGLGIKF